MALPGQIRDKLFMKNNYLSTPWSPFADIRTMQGTDPRSSLLCGGAETAPMQVEQVGENEWGGQEIGA